MDGLSGLLQSQFPLLPGCFHLCLESAVLLLGLLDVVGDAGQELLVISLQELLEDVVDDFLAGDLLQLVLQVIPHALLP
jgi:hypothetical protein